MATSKMVDNQISGRILNPLVRAISGNDSARQLFYHRMIVLLITFFIYTVYHMSRRPLSIVKSSIVQNCTALYPDQYNESTVYGCNEKPFNNSDAIQLMGILDTCFLITYAIFMFVAGYFAERSNLRYFLSLSLISCGSVCILFGLGHTFNIHALWYFIIIQILSGIVQTTGWPAVVAVVGYWFGSTKKGGIFGVWNWNTSVGNILGAVIAGAFADIDWTLSFVVPGLISIGMGVLVFFLLIPSPACVGLKVSLAEENEKEEPDNNVFHIKQTNQDLGEAKMCTVVEENPKKEQAISIWQALLIPGVIEFSACLFFVKFVSYTFLYWLPLYLNNKGGFSPSSSAFISVTFDLGGCIGSLIAGVLADQTGASGLTCIVFFIFTIPSLILFDQFATDSTILLHSLQFITGLFINGPYALITTAVSANLACKVPSQSAMATVSAIIDGTGSIGAALGPSLAGFLSKTGWENVFYMLIVTELCAFVSLLRIGFFQEFSRIRKRFSSKTYRLF